MKSLRKNQNLLYAKRKRFPNRKNPRQKTPTGPGAIAAAATASQPALVQPTAASGNLVEFLRERVIGALIGAAAGAVFGPLVVLLMWNRPERWYEGALFVEIGWAIAGALTGTHRRVIESFPPAIRPKLLALRRLIFETAASTEGVGPVTETLKWGEPAYLTDASGSGTTIRIGWKPAAPTRYAMYFHCRTGLVDRFRELFPDEFGFERNRAIVFEQSDTVPRAPLSMCIAMALTHHRTKKPAPKC